MSLKDKEDEISLSDSHEPFKLVVFTFDLIHKTKHQSTSSFIAGLIKLGVNLFTEHVKLD